MSSIPDSIHGTTTSDASRSETNVAGNASSSSRIHDNSSSPQLKGPEQSIHSQRHRNIVDDDDDEGRELEHCDLGDSAFSVVSFSLNKSSPINSALTVCTVGDGSTTSIAQRSDGNAKILYDFGLRGSEKTNEKSISRWAPSSAHLVQPAFCVGNVEHVFYVSLFFSFILGLVASIFVVLSPSLPIASTSYQGLPDSRLAS